MATDTHSKPSFSPSRKWSAGLHVIFLICVVLSVVGMVNYISRDFFLRFHWSSRAKNELSPRTVHFLQSLTNHVKVTLYYDRTDPLYGTVAALLEEYRLVNRKISV